MRHSEYTRKSPQQYDQGFGDAKYWNSDAFESIVNTFLNNSKCSLFSFSLGYRQWFNSETLPRLRRLR